MTHLTDLLPIGSVAIIRVQTQPVYVMITGYLPQNGNSIHDYLGVPYPEGMGQNAGAFVFDAVNIAQVIARGVDDQQASQYRADIQKIINQYYAAQSSAAENAEASEN